MTTTMRWNSMMIYFVMSCGHEKIASQSRSLERHLQDLTNFTNQLERKIVENPICLTCGIRHGGEGTERSRPLYPEWCHICNGEMKVTGLRTTEKWVDEHKNIRTRFLGEDSVAGRSIKELKLALKDYQVEAKWNLDEARARNANGFVDPSRTLDILSQSYAYQGAIEDLKRHLRRAEVLLEEKRERSLGEFDEEVHPAAASPHVEDWYKNTKMREIPSLACFSDSIVFKYDAPPSLSEHRGGQVRRLFDRAFYAANAGPSARKKFNLQSFDWADGTCKMWDDKRVHRLGKMIKEAASLVRPSLALAGETDEWIDDLLKAFETRTLQKWVCHITADPWDVLHMSTGTGWTSCMREQGQFPWGPICESMKGSILLRFFRPMGKKTFITGADGVKREKLPEACGRELLRVSFEEKDGKLSPVILRAGRVYGAGLAITDEELTSIIGIPVRRGANRKGLLLGSYDDGGGSETYVGEEGMASALRKHHKEWMKLAKAWRVSEEKKEKFFGFFGIETGKRQGRDLAPPVEFAGDVW